MEMEARAGWDKMVNEDAVRDDDFEITLQGRESAFLLLPYQHHMVIVAKLNTVSASDPANQRVVDDLRKLPVLTAYS